MTVAAVGRADPNLLPSQVSLSSSACSSCASWCVTNQHTPHPWFNPGLILQHISGVHRQGILLLLKRAGLLCKARPELICRGMCVQRSGEEKKLTLARQNTNDEKMQSSACDTRREVRRRSTQQLSLPRPPACPFCPFFGSAGAGAPLTVSLFGAIVLARACPLSRGAQHLCRAPPKKGARRRL